ncbi:hypothetical protein HAX54_031133, partial [Datura stramonium]|nr:hypothetical protein [Datura stramonium]
QVVSGTNDPLDVSVIRRCRTGVASNGSRKKSLLDVTGHCMSAVVRFFRFREEVMDQVRLIVGRNES